MWPIAVITFLEGIRNRLFFGIFLFALFAILMGIIFSSFFMQDLGKIAFDFNISAISFAGLLIAFSVSVNLIAKDLDKRTIYSVLSKPVSRGEYIFGKYLGLLLITFVAFLILTALTMPVILFMRDRYADYFESFRWAAYFQAIYFDYLKLSLLNAVILLFSTLSSSSFITMMFSLSVYIAGQTISDVVNFISSQALAAEISQSVKQTIAIAKYLLPNFSAFDFKVISAHGHLLGIKEFFLFTGYGLGYTLIMLLLAVLVFRRKEFL